MVYTKMKPIRDFTAVSALLLTGMLLFACNDSADTKLEGNNSADNDVPVATSPSEPTTETPSISVINFNDLSAWNRFGDQPVLRDFEEQGYEIAADLHPFIDENGEIKGVYTGPVKGSEYSAIKLAKSDDYVNWKIVGTLVDGLGPSALDSYKETAFYRQARSGKHQIYYIGYNDGDVYDARIFKAEADQLEGPYTLADAPVIDIGLQDGQQIELMTSPSIVSYEDDLYMLYCAWDSFNNTTQVWTMGAISRDDGKTWGEHQRVDAPVCMEGAFTQGPDNQYYAIGEQDIGFVMGRAAMPFGNYERLPNPVLTAAGAPWESDEMIAPQLLFDDKNQTVYLYYSGADHLTGWWTMLATTQFQ